MREPQNKRRLRREDRYCNWNIFCYVSDAHTCTCTPLVICVGDDTRGGGMEAVIKLIYVVEDYTNLMSHSS